MNLDDLSRSAAAETRTAARTMPVVPIGVVRKRRVLQATGPLVGLAVGLWVTLAVSALPDSVEPPALTDVTSTTTTTPTSESTNAVTVIESERPINSDALADLPTFLDTQIPVIGASSPCCVAARGDGAVYVLDTWQLLLVAGGATEVVADWTDVEGRGLILTADGPLVLGTGQLGSVVRLLGLDGTPRWSVDVPFASLGERPQLAVDRNGVIWVGIRDLLPTEAGFAQTQWLAVATMTGASVERQSRSEARPLPDGNSLIVEANGVALVDDAGNSTAYTLPPGFEVVTAQPFLEGLLIVAKKPTDSEFGALSVIYATEEKTDGVAIERYWGSTPLDGATVAITPDQVIGLFVGEEGPTLSLGTIDRIQPVPPLSLENPSWIAGGLDRITDASGEVIARFDPYTNLGRLTLWDGDTGLILADERGVVWLRPASDPRVVLDPGVAEMLIGAAVVDGRHVVGTAVAGSGVVRWFELETGAETTAPEGARTYDHQTFSAQGRRAFIVAPDWSGVERGEAGEPLPPFDLPRLVVEDAATGEDLLDIPVGTEERPYASIHDFDGRRIVLVAVPNEPASPPQTAWIVDLECSDCTERIEDGGPTWYDLVGELTSEGPVVDTQLE
ncbi:MAG: hypothetical protein OEX04_12695 [Acidimicrobiia bacterium]|nr:hypothetical protein [Acidimicrobiia bacterium]MDH4308327.1 hypothetical protein [Acidimicrobiia bacterium]